MKLLFYIAVFMIISFANFEQSVWGEELIYFYTSGCKKCKKVDPIVDKLFQKKDITGKIVSGYSEKFEFDIKKFNIDNIKYTELLMAYAKAYDVPLKKKMVTPAVFYGKGYLVGDKEIRNKLGGLIKDNRGVDAPEINVAEGKKNIIKTYQAISLAAILGAGLLDGINPCTMTALIFFMSLLVLAKDRKKMAYTAGAFIIGNYIAYFCIGLGFFKGVSILKELKMARFGLYGIGGALSWVMAGISMKDYQKARIGDFDAITLKLPDKMQFLSKRLLKNQDLRENKGFINIILGAFIVGIAIAGIEFICTGQVYLPSIIYMTGVEGYRIGATGKLGLYNLMVVLPQIILALVVISGIKVLKIGEGYRKNIAKVKLALTVFFSLIGVYMIKELILI